ncbi:MAG: hypothetical protein M3R40_10885 [Pseudomonadota bacterium]|nr:hypothetical protein [Pseudomonadota bacterium]
MALALASPVLADFHTFQIEQIYSNADKTVQFIVMHESQSQDGQQFWRGHDLTSTSAGGTNTFVFPKNLPNAATADTRVLIATQGFAALGLIAPDYVIPNGFLGTGAGTLNCGGVAWGRVRNGRLPARK